MDERVLRLRTAEDCGTFAENAAKRGFAELAVQARQRAVQLRAEQYGAKTKAEKECLEAVYAYEEVLYLKHGKRVRASRTWQSIQSKGVLAAVDAIVSHDRPTAGYASLMNAGLHDFVFEAVVLRYPKLFSRETRNKSAARMAEWKSGRSMDEQAPLEES